MFHRQINQPKPKLRKDPNFLPDYNIAAQETRSQKT